MKKNKPAALPKSVDVIVIGGGIIGCSSAYYLAKRGLSVVVFEKCHSVGYEQSSRNWGFVRQLGRDPKELPLMMRSNAIWQGLEKELEADLGWHQGGIMGMTDDQSVLPDYDKWRDVAKTFDLETKVLTASEVAELMPDMAQSRSGGIYVPGDGSADPDVTTQAFADALSALGGRVETNCCVLDIEMQGGVVNGVISECGTVKAPIVIVAAGAWASRVLDWVGRDMPQMRIRGSVARTMAVDRITDVAAWTPSLGFVQRRDGCFNIAGLDVTDHDICLESLHYMRYFFKELIENHDRIHLCFGIPFLHDLIGRIPGTPAMRDPLRRARVQDPMPNTRQLGKCLDLLRATFPALAGVGIKKAWAGHIDLTPDMLPVIDGETGVKGLIVAAGFSGHGFGIGPGAGAAIAELASGEQPQVDLSDFALDRFTSGNWDKPYNLI